MPTSVQEQSSTFSSTTKKSVQVVQSSGGSFDQQSTSGGQDISSSASASSLASDSTLRDLQVGRFDDFTFRPTILNFDSMMSTMGMGNEFEDVTRDVCQTNEGQTFEMKLDVQDYKPNEIAVKISENLMTVTGKQEIKSETSSSSRQFCKKFTVPSGVKAENIQCTFSTSGVLKITAPIARSQQAITSGESVTSTKQTQQQHKQVSKTQQQESVSSSRKSSLGSDISSIDELVVRPRRVDLSSLMDSANISRELSTIQDGKKFEMKLEVKNFKQDEVQVKITKTLIKIEGKHESEFASRSFYKEFTIPYGVKTSEIQCTMSDEGILTISAPVHQNLPQQPLGSSSVTQQVTQTSTTSVSSGVQEQQQQQQHKRLQETGRADSRESVSSTTSSVREQSSRRLEDLVLRPVMDFDFDSFMNQRGSLLEDISKQVSRVDEGKKFETKLDVHEYKPEEIQVKIANNMVIIEGNQKTETSTRSFYKSFSIPTGVKVEKIQSSLNSQGVLTISAPIETSTTEQQLIQQQQQVHKKLQEAGRTDSRESVSSTTSSIRETSRRMEDLMLRPIMDFDFDAIMNQRGSLFEDVSKQVSRIDEGKKFEVKLDVHEYKPEEMFVKIANQMVIIEAKQEITTTTGTSSRQLYKKFSIPSGVKVEKIQSSLSPQGILTISAPIETTATSNIEQQMVQQQQKTQTQSVQQQSQQVSQQQQQHSDSSTSISSNISSVSSKLADFVLRPSMDLDALMAKDSRFEDISKQICQVNDGKKFETKVEVPNFKPESLKIKVSDNFLIIEGKEETASSSKQFYKKFSLPPGVKPESISSSLSTSGVLTVSAPIDQSELQKHAQSHTTMTSTTSVTRSEQVLGSTNTNRDGVMGRQQIVLKPKMNFGDVSSVHSSFEDVSKDLYHVCDGQTFEMKLHVEDYRPEEIEVRISENLVTIEGKTEMREENNFKSRQFCKKFSVPAGVSPQNITCTLQTDGMLVVTAPIDKSSEQQKLMESQSQQVQSQTQTSKKVTQSFSSTTSSSSQQQQQMTSSSTSDQKHISN